MTDQPPRKDASGAQNREEWLARMEEICADEGYIEPLGPRHHAFFHDDGPLLLVTFETLDSIRTGHDSQMPKGWQIATQRGWSHLCIIAEGETWYRDQALFRYFDRLVDDAFFDDFDRVLFYGAAMGGYAAAAFSVTAPGATVLAIQPRATLDPDLAGWDSRNRSARRLNFTDRYGFAPDMIEGAGQVFIALDPQIAEDAMHAALFARPFVTRLRARFMGATLDTALTHMGVLAPLLEQAMAGTLTRLSFARQIRLRRAYGPYLKRLLERLEAEGRLRRALGLCRSVNQRLSAPRFRRKQANLELRLAALQDAQ